MKLGIENVLPGMLIKHPNYEGMVVVESITDPSRDTTIEESRGIYWRHVSAAQTGGLLQGIPNGAILDIDDPIIREAMKGAATLLVEVSPGWNLTKQYKTAAHLIKVRVSALTQESLNRIGEQPRLNSEIELLNSRRALIHRTLERNEKGGLRI